MNWPFPPLPCACILSTAFVGRIRSKSLGAACASARSFRLSVFGAGKSLVALQVVDGAVEIQEPQLSPVLDNFDSISRHCPNGIGATNDPPLLRIELIARFPFWAVVCLFQVTNRESIGDFIRMRLNESAASVAATTYLKIMPHTAPVNIGVNFGPTGRSINTSLVFRKWP